jgi:dTDP-4-amino-4,6-dideoxygalactose transaminase
MRIPFVDLKAQYKSLKEEIDMAIASVIDETAFISGKHAQHFEKDFSAFTGVEHTIACANGTDSLEILLQAMGVGRGDEVIVPAISWISTSEAVSTVGARPVFVDVDEHGLMDLTQVESRITAHTKAIIPVHLYGNPVDMARVMEIAQKHRLLVLEDCAQSHGAMIGDKQAGTFGDAASYSFYPGKNLGAYGDAGAMSTSNEQLARVSRAIANHGQEGKHNHIMEGRNSRMDGLQAAILRVKLPHLQLWTERRISRAALYTQLLDIPEVKLPVVRKGFRHVYHLFVIRTQQRDALAVHLKEQGIETSIHYPVPLPLMPCYKQYNHTPTSFPMATSMAAEILSLPMYAELTDGQVGEVCSAIRSFFGH